MRVLKTVLCVSVAVLLLTVSASADLIPVPDGDFESGPGLSLGPWRTPVRPAYRTLLAVTLIWMKLVMGCISHTRTPAAFCTTILVSISLRTRRTH